MYYVLSMQREHVVHVLRVHLYNEHVVRVVRVLTEIITCCFFALTPYIGRVVNRSLMHAFVKITSNWYRIYTHKKVMTHCAHLVLQYRREHVIRVIRVVSAMITCHTRCLCSGNTYDTSSRLMNVSYVFPKQIERHTRICSQPIANVYDVLYIWLLLPTYLWGNTSYT